MSARAGGREGLAAIARLVGLRDELNFAVFRILQDVEEVEALGSVADILLRAFDPNRSSARMAVAPSSHHTVPPPAAPSIARIAVMEGSLSEVDVASLIQVVRSSR